MPSLVTTHWLTITDLPALTVTLAMIGKLAITASYGVIYIFSTEQFPTVIRNAGLGAGSTSARMGSVLAPIINETVFNKKRLIKNSKLIFWKF